MKQMMLLYFLAVPLLTQDSSKSDNFTQYSLKLNILTILTGDVTDCSSCHIYYPMRPSSSWLLSTDSKIISGHILSIYYISFAILFVLSKKMALMEGDTKEEDNAKVVRNTKLVTN